MQATQSVSGVQYRESVAVDVLQDFGVKPTDGNIKKLIDASTVKAKGNGYLNRDELVAAAKEAFGKPAINKQFVPTQAIDKALAAGRVPKSVDDNFDLYMLPNGQLRTRPNMLPVGQAGLRATSKSIGGQVNQYGGYDFRLAPGEQFKHAKWVKASMETVVRALHKGNKADTILAGLKNLALDVTKERDLLLATGSKHKEPLIFDFEYSPGRSGFNPNGGHLPPTRSIVTVCEAVQEWSFGQGGGLITVKKPVIYLYPEKKTNVAVEVQVDGQFIAQYPKTEKGRWDVVATPDGTLFDPKSERRFSYLFWEAKSMAHWEIDPRKAHCVARADMETFLEKVSGRYGLNDRERTDFITYWIGALTQKPYAMIQLLSESEYEQRARMTVTPKPDSVIRLFMIFMGLDDKLNAGNPELPMKKRTGFAVVEWGGANLDE